MVEGNGPGSVTAFGLTLPERAEVQTTSNIGKPPPLLLDIYAVLREVDTHYVSQKEVMADEPIERWPFGAPVPDLKCGRSKIVPVDPELIQCKSVARRETEIIHISSFLENNVSRGACIPDQNDFTDFCNRG